MIDFVKMRSTIVQGLTQYLGCPVVRSNQNETPPEDDEIPTVNYPYVSYTITRIANETKGSYGEYDDGIDRIPMTQAWSVTVLSDDNSECLNLTQKAHDWFNHAGLLYLSDNDVIVQSVGGITNRDNVITTEYEYRNGFDVVFWTMNEVTRDTGVIETVALDDRTAEYIDYNDMLEQRLNGEGVSE